MVTVDWCCLCKKNGETTDHLFLHCPLAQELWNMVWSLFGVYWVMRCGVVDILVSWLGKLNRHKTWFGVWSLIVLSYVKNWFLSWNISCYRPCLTGQMLQVFLLLTLCLICLLFVLSMLFDLFIFFCLLAHCLCALLLSVFSFSIFQWSLLIIQKKKKKVQKSITINF